MLVQLSNIGYIQKKTPLSSITGTKGEIVATLYSLSFSKKVDCYEEIIKEKVQFIKLLKKANQKTFKKKCHHFKHFKVLDF